MKNRKGITINNAFRKILYECNRKPNDIYVDKSGKFYNRSMKSWLQDNNIEMSSVHNKGKSLVAERFTRTLKNEIYKSMISISKKCVYF